MAQAQHVDFRGRAGPILAGFSDRGDESLGIVVAECFPSRWVWFDTVPELLHGPEGLEAPACHRDPVVPRSDIRCQASAVDASGYGWIANYILLIGGRGHETHQRMELVDDLFARLLGKAQAVLETTVSEDGVRPREPS